MKIYNLNELKHLKSMTMQMEYIECLSIFIFQVIK